MAEMELNTRPGALPADLLDRMGDAASAADDGGASMRRIMTAALAAAEAAGYALVPIKELIKLQAFKSYVHERLDRAGIPTHPNGEHSQAGCRVGDRLDIVLGVIPPARKILRTLNYHIENAPPDALPVFTGITELHDALGAVEEK